MNAGGGISESEAWESPYPARGYVLDPTNTDSWLDLYRAYAREGSGQYPPVATDRPLYRCLEVARENGARCAIVETRYIDLDYRSEFSSFYSRAFQPFPGSAHRVHFFDQVVSVEDAWRLPPDVTYLGYMVVRPPTIAGVVGRTMLAPPTSLHDAVRTGVREVVGFFGQTLTVRAVPFLQQDARLGSCAHAASWVCHYSAYRGERGVGRRTIGEFSAAVDPGLGVGRTLPSTGLTLHQMSQVLGAFGVPALYYEVATLSDVDRPETWPNRHKGPQARVARVCCRYLNSALPVIIVLGQILGSGKTDGHHAIAVCGYWRDDDAPGGVAFVVHDDRRGPYLTVTDPLKDVDERAEVSFKWEEILAPVPEKLWLSGESAERTGCSHLLAAAAKAVDDGIEEAQVILTLHRAKNLTVRSFATTSNRFKERIREHCADARVVRAYSYARLPRYMWVVEAVDRNARERGEPAVLGEVVFDATSDDLEPSILALRLPGIIAIPRPDDPDWDTPSTADAIMSQGQLQP